jgi:hypothetical protein
MMMKRSWKENEILFDNSILFMFIISIYILNKILKDDKQDFSENIIKDQRF